MPTVNHDEIVERFLSSKAINFEALGQFVAENGASIAASSSGDYGVRFGHYNILACFNIRGPVEVLDRTRFEQAELTAELLAR